MRVNGDPQRADDRDGQHDRDRNLDGRALSSRSMTNHRSLTEIRFTAVRPKPVTARENPTLECFTMVPDNEPRHTAFPGISGK